MTHLNSRVFLPAVTACIGLVWVVVGIVFHGWWIDGRPGSGFFPSLVGGVLVLVSVITVWEELKGAPPTFNVSHLFPIAAVVAIILSVLLIGFFPALTLYVFSWLKWYEKYTGRFAALITVVTIASMYGVFSLWLRVPFPQGVILEAIGR